MLGLNVFSLLTFAGLNLAVAALCRYSEERRTRILRVLCILLLSYNLFKYSLSPLLGRGLKIPVEFSTVSYFLVTTLYLSGVRWAQSWAAYSALMAGFFYYMTMILTGGSIYGDWPPFETYMALSCHGTLYVFGLVSLRTRQFRPAEGFLLAGGVGYVVLNAALFRPTVAKGTRLFIYELMDAVYARKLLPESLWSAAIPIYYVVMAGLVLLTIQLFFRLNRALYGKSRREEPVTEPAPAALQIPA